MTWLLIIELAGAAIILVAFGANAAGRWSVNSRPYLWLNLLGSILLGIVAWTARRWGFVMLEVAWLGITLHNLFQTRRAAPGAKEEHPMSTDRARLLQLIDELALARGHFILASGKESTFYLDGRMVTLSPEGAYLTGKLLFAQLRDLHVQAVGGLTMGADPIATAVAVVSHLEGQPIPAFLVRKDVKAHGTQKQVEGPLPRGARVAIVEDTVTTGESALKAIAAVEAQGCTVAIVLALIDRLEGARERLEAAGYQFAPLFTIRDLGIE